MGWSRFDAILAWARPAKNTLKKTVLKKKHSARLRILVGSALIFVKSTKRWSPPFGGLTAEAPNRTVERDTTNVILRDQVQRTAPQKMGSLPEWTASLPRYARPCPPTLAMPRMTEQPMPKGETS